MNMSSQQNALVGGFVAYSISSVNLTDCKSILSGTIGVDQVYSLVGISNQTIANKTVSDDFVSVNTTQPSS